ncbi:hypothetical protein ABLO27_05420 [Roseibium sp. SCPC15]|uniref:hypothetical protein n=1 Tax=Roseibium sp. SCP15 TaxID=3141376 RepID=UPI003337B249
MPKKTGPLLFLLSSALRLDELNKLYNGLPIESPQHMLFVFKLKESLLRPIQFVLSAEETGAADQRSDIGTVRTAEIRAVPPVFRLISLRQVPDIARAAALQAMVVDCGMPPA